MNQYFYLLYVGANIIMAACVYFYYPETSGMSLEAVDVIFTGDYTTWRGAVKKSLRMRKAIRRGDAQFEDLHLASSTAPLAASDSRLDATKTATEKVEQRERRLA